MRKLKQRISIPTRALFDQRLTSIERDVLLALCFFEDPKSHISAPQRKDIAKLFSIHETRVSLATKRLNDFEWIIKEGSGKNIKYFINWANEPSSVSEGSETKPSLVGEGLTPSTLVCGRGLEHVEQVEHVEPSSVGEGREHANRSNPRPSDRVQPVGENQGTTISSNINNYNNNKYFRSSDIRSDLIVYGSAIKLLVDNGMPENFLKGRQWEKYKAIILNEWCNQPHINITMLEQACLRAKEAKNKTNECIGVGYVNSCLKTIINEVKKNETEKFSTQEYSDIDWPAKNDAA